MNDPVKFVRGDTVTLFNRRFNEDTWHVQMAHAEQRTVVDSYKDIFRRGWAPWVYVFDNGLTLTAREIALNQRSEL